MKKELALALGRRSSYTWTREMGRNGESGDTVATINARSSKNKLFEDEEAREGWRTDETEYKKDGWGILK